MTPRKGKKFRTSAKIEDLTLTHEHAAGIDVHGIPPKQREPYHLHHDLIWCFRAANERIAATPEAPELLWAGADDWGRLDLTQSIRNSIARVFGSVAR